MRQPCLPSPLLEKTQSHASSVANHPLNCASRVLAAALAHITTKLNARCCDPVTLLLCDASLLDATLRHVAAALMMHLPLQRARFAAAVAQYLPLQRAHVVRRCHRASTNAASREPRTLRASHVASLLAHRAFLMSAKRNNTNKQANKTNNSCRVTVLL